MPGLVLSHLDALLCCSRENVLLVGCRILDKHATLTRVGDKYTLTPCENAKVVHNGKKVTAPFELAHLDRLVFGTSQYFLFVLPSQANTNDPYYTFEMMQDEIGKASGLISSSNKNMTQGIYISSRSVII